MQPEPITIEATGVSEKYVFFRCPRCSDEDENQHVFHFAHRFNVGVQRCVEEIGPKQMLSAADSCQAELSVKIIPTTPVLIKGGETISNARRVCRILNTPSFADSSDRSVVEARRQTLRSMRMK